MAKIYNEIVIDMNPESSTFEETLFEDSFEYSGDMILAQDETGTEDTYEGPSSTNIFDIPEKYIFPLFEQEAPEPYTPWYLDTSGDGKYDTEVFYDFENDRISTRGGTEAQGGGVTHHQVPTSYTSEGLSNQIADVARSLMETYGGIQGHPRDKDEIGDMAGGATLHGEVMTALNVEGLGESTEWGAESISVDDFINPDTGNPRTIDDIYNLLQYKLPNIEESALKLEIKDMLPKYEGIKGATEREYESTVYGLQEEAQKVGDPYSLGMGTSTRAAYKQEKKIGTEFQRAGEVAKEKAGEEFEAEVEEWVEPEWLAREGGYIFRDGSGIGRNTKNKKTFLDVLSELPEAGGS